MIREDRKLFAELAQLNRDMASLCLRMMDGSASVAEQQDYAQQLIAAGERLRRRADETYETVEMTGIVIEGEVLLSASPALPEHSVEPYRTHE